jgi:hypothetical protein
MTAPEKRLLEEMLEQGLGVKRKAAAPRKKAATPGVNAEPKKRAATKTKVTTRKSKIERDDRSPGG